MPAVRAAAAEAAAQLPSHALPPTALQPSSYPPPSTLAATSNQVALEFSQSQPINERPEEADFRWAQEQYSATQRSLDTWTFFSVFRARLWLLDQKWSYLGGFSEAAKKERTRSLARYLLASVLNLGPTFIKLDRVPAFSAQKAMAIIEADLGRPVARLFKSWDPRPIAAASLGQVHRAVLWTGEEVVVKVQRPGLRQLFDIDLNNLKLLAEQLDKADEDNRDFRGIYKECAKVLYEEIDYIAEGRNSDRFRRNFRDVPWVRVPKVYWEYCSPRVLTMEYLPGVKISSAQQLQAAGLDCDTVARRATEAYLIQILKHGFFHADPHPGNVSVDIQGNLLFYDFGMMGEIVPGIKDKLLDTFYGIYKQDTQAVINALIALGVIKPTGDALTLRRAIGYFINNLARQTERQETIQAIGEDLFSIAVDQPFRFPATFTFVLRAFSTLEGIGKSLNPTYRFTDVATPYAQELLQLQDSRGQQSLLVSQLQQQATELGVAAAAMPQRVARMSSLLEQLEAGEVKLRVRVLEAERAARRAGVMQAATLNVVGGMGFVNVATVLGTTGHEGPALACLLLGCVFGVLTWRGFVRVERLDKFEKDLRG
ncbi:ABC1 family-domain-containing protein [Haematococcus lacustris]